MRCDAIYAMARCDAMQREQALTKTDYQDPADPKYLVSLGFCTALLTQGRALLSTPVAGYSVTLRPAPLLARGRGGGQCKYRAYIASVSQSSSDCLAARRQFLSSHVSHVLHVSRGLEHHSCQVTGGMDKPRQKKELGYG